MHVVIGGCGRVGSQLTVNLARHGHTISIIDKKPNAFEKLPPGFEGQTLVGMVFDRETLEQAGIRDAGAYIAVTNGDNSNIVSARVAKEHYNIERVVARIYDPRRAEIYQRLGIKTVATVRWASAEIYDVLFHGIEHTELAIGSGDIGSCLAEDLTDRHHQVVVIEQQSELAARAKNQINGATVIHGDACEPWVLERAEAARADVVVAATGDDEDNLVISLLAKQEFAVPRVIARVNHPKNQWLFTESWGVDVAMSPPHILGALIEEAVSVGDLVKLFRLEHGRVALGEVTLPGDSPVVGKHI